MIQCLFCMCVSNDKACISYHNGVLSAMPFIVGPGILVVLGGASLVGKRGSRVEKYKIQEVN